MFFETQFGRIAFSTFGEGRDRPIIFIHGFPFDRSMWDEQARLLEKDHFVVTFDIRGHGESDEGSGQYLVEFFVDDLIALMDHLGLDRACLCGLSMGGYTALRAVEREPSRFSGLILCDTKSTPDTNGAKINRASQIKTILEGKKAQFADAQLKALLAPESFERNKQDVEKIRKKIVSTKDAGLIGVLIALAARTDSSESLGSIAVPTLIVVGERDRVTPLSDAELMHSRIRGSRLEIIRGAGHLSDIENSAGFNSVLQEFLSANNL